MRKFCAKQVSLVGPLGAPNANCASCFDAEVLLAKGRAHCARTKLSLLIFVFCLRFSHLWALRGHKMTTKIGTIFVLGFMSFSTNGYIATHIFGFSGCLAFGSGPTPPKPSLLYFFVAGHCLWLLARFWFLSKGLPHIVGACPPSTNKLLVFQ